MNWKKIFTIAALTGFSASVATGQGTAPTIVQGDYISNVFGQSNFIKNPNAKLNAKDVTVSSATVSRSATTPLVATSEFNVAVTLANGTATWATRTFDAGMKNQNCEARFSYRGFQSTSKAQVKQGANVVAELALSATGTDPRIASINFPCGDLSQPTTFVVTDTAVLAGTNEIGGIYVGLATNQANVAQAEAVLNVFRSTALSVPTATGTTVLWNDIGLDALGEYTAATGIYKAKRAGQYLVSAQILYDLAAWTAGNQNDLYIQKNNASTSSNVNYLQGTVTTYITAQVTATVALAVGDEIKIVVRQGTGSTRNLIANGQYNHLKIYRFPTSSELVVTPERQNTFAGITSDLTSGTGSTSSATFVQVSGLGNYTSLGKATSPGSMQFTVPTIPPGSYKLDFQLLAEATPGATGDRTDCIFSVYDGSTDRTAAYLSSKQEVTSAGTPVQGGVIGSVVIQYTSVQSNKQFTVRARRNGGTGTCNWFGASGYASFFTISPLDQPSNSALYVEGPVKASATGAAISAGYVGEVTRSTKSSTNLTTGTYVNITSITLPSPGVYLLSANGVFKKNGATYTAAEYFLPVISNVNNGDNVAFPFQSQGQYFRDGLSTAFSEIGVTTNQIYVRYDGTNITWPSGSTTSSGVLYLNAFSTIFTSGTPLFTNGLLQAIRIN
jgi:hypothetical protein